MTLALLFSNSSDGSQCRLKARDLDQEIQACRQERTRLMDVPVPPLLEVSWSPFASCTQSLKAFFRVLLQRLGDLQETTVLEGDFDFKVARQDYYLSKQKRVMTLPWPAVHSAVILMRYVVFAQMLQHLTAQQARHKFLIVAMDAETAMLVPHE